MLVSIAQLPVDSQTAILRLRRYGMFARRWMNIVLTVLMPVRWGAGKTPSLPLSTGSQTEVTIAKYPGTREYDDCTGAEQMLRGVSVTMEQQLPD